MNLVFPSPKFYQRLFEEDQVEENHFYSSNLPQENVTCSLKVKEEMLLSGLAYFFGAFRYLGAKEDSHWHEIFQEYEGRHFSSNEEINFELPFHFALTGERIALNLLQRSSSISSYTNKFVTLAQSSGLSILDTRKTTPGLRTLEKYAVRMGGGLNHRFSQTDLWMIKDNHKKFFGGVEKSISFFKSIGSFYKDIELEVHSENEFNEGIELGVKNFMLDNFNPESIKKVIEHKPAGIRVEVSGGINLENISNYLISGVDAISVGSLTYGAPPVDLSLKIK